MTTKELEIHKAFECEDFIITVNTESTSNTDCIEEGKALAELLYNNLPSRTIQALIDKLKTLYYSVEEDYQYND